MSVTHERDIDWSDDTFTLPNDADVNDDPIRVVFESAIMRDGGSYAVWYEPDTRGAPVEDGLSLDRAKRRAVQLQDEHGSPILETVDEV